jgi:hypothetical protein
VGLDLRHAVLLRDIRSTGTARPYPREWTAPGVEGIHLRCPP